MSERISTAGMYLLYAVESTKGTKPTSGFKKIPEVKSMPSFNPSPNTIQSTTLEETEYHTYVAGLKDLGGALEYGANLTEDLIKEWEALITAYNGAQKDGGKATWFLVYHPKLSKGIYYQGTPIPLSLNEAEVDAMLETTLYIAPNSAPEWAEAPEDIEQSIHPEAV